MEKLKKWLSLITNLIFFIQVLLLFLLIFEDRIELPAWLQVAGRLHPMVLHLPIGFLIFLIILLFIQNTFRKKQFRKILKITLMLAAVSASVTALFGFFLSRQGDYGQEVLYQHKLSGVLLSFVTFFLLAWYNTVRKRVVVFYGSMAITLILLVAAGHTGSVLTHGENFILAPVTQSQKEISVETSSLYEIAISPILDKKCFSCHNERKAKGKLIMTSMEKFKLGGENGVEWIAGNPDSSRLIQYIHLPVTDDNHMPPEGKPQLTQEEIFALESWIRSGADFERRLTEYSAEDTLRKWTEIKMKNLNTETVEKSYPFSGVSQQVIDNLNTPFRTVTPLYVNSPALQVDFFIRGAYKATMLEELKTIAEQLVSLNLSKMPVTDDQLKIVAQFKNLEKLNLNSTDITGATLVDLMSLNSLQSLSLSGTRVSNQQIKSLLALPDLRQLFVWNTGVQESAVEEWSKAYPNVKVTYSLYKDSSVQRLTKPFLVSEGIIERGGALVLKHPMPGVSTYYTLDGTPPDTVQGLVYKNPVPINETVKVTAIACKDGWFCSGLFEYTSFVEGIAPVRAELLTPADKKYPGLGSTSLTDGKKGFIDVLNESSWLGYRDSNFEAGFSFGDNPPTLNKIVLSYGDNVGGYLFPPTEVEVWGGESASKLKRIKTISGNQPTAYRSQSVDAITISIDSSRYAYYKVVAKPVKALPSWHSGKGKKGWFFVDEVFFY